MENHLAQYTTKELITELRRRKELALKAKETAKAREPLCRNCKHFNKSFLEDRYQKGYCAIRSRFPHAKQVDLLGQRKQTRAYYTCPLFELKNEN